MKVLFTVFLGFTLFSAYGQESQVQMQQLEQRVAKLEKSSSKPSVNLKGFIQLDTAIYQLEDDFRETGLDDIQSGTHFRRLRFDARGELSAGFSYRLQLEFAGQKVGYKNIHLNYNLENAQIRLGNTKLPQSHEYLRSSSDVYFIERSLATGAFSTGRQTGLQIQGHLDKRMTYHAGVYTDATGDRANDEKSVIFTGARLTGLILDEDNYLLHLGGHFMNSSSESSPRFRTGPESRVSRIRPIDTGNIEGDKVNRYGAEFMVLFSDWRLSYEYMGAKVDRPDITLEGHVLETATSLTGEKRDYSRKSGTLKGLTPQGSWTHGGWGALELGLRTSWVDLNDSVLVADGVNAGKGLTVASNLSWIPVENLMFSAEVGRLDLENVGSVKEEKIRHYHLRAQVSF